MLKVSAFYLAVLIFSDGFGEDGKKIKASTSQESAGKKMVYSAKKLF